MSGSISQTNLFEYRVTPRKFVQPLRPLLRVDEKKNLSADIGTPTVCFRPIL